MKFILPSSIFCGTCLITQGATTFEAANYGTGVANNIFVEGNWDNGVPTTANPGTIGGDATWWPADTAGDGTGATTAAANNVSGVAITVTGGTLGRVGNFIPEFTDSSITLQGGNMSNDGPGSRVFRLSGTSTLTIGSGSTFTTDASRSIELQDDGSGIPSIVLNGGILNADTGANLGVSTTDSAYAFLTMGLNGGTANLTGITFNVSNPFINFLSGSTGVIKVTGADYAYYESLWDSSNLRVAGVNSGTFAGNFTVSGNELSLVPEPSLVLLGCLGILPVMRRRRAH